jgi:hypothetical protein
VVRANSRKVAHSEVILRRALLPLSPKFVGKFPHHLCYTAAGVGHILRSHVFGNWESGSSHIAIIPFERSRPAADASREVNGAVVA